MSSQKKIEVKKDSKKDNKKSGNNTTTKDNAGSINNNKDKDNTLGKRGYSSLAKEVSFRKQGSKLFTKDGDGSSGHTEAELEAIEAAAVIELARIQEAIAASRPLLFLIFTNSKCRKDRLLLEKMVAELPTTLPYVHADTTNNDDIDAIHRHIEEHSSRIHQGINAPTLLDVTDEEGNTSTLLAEQKDEKTTNKQIDSLLLFINSISYANMNTILETYKEKVQAVLKCNFERDIGKFSVNTEALSGEEMFEHIVYSNISTYIQHQCNLPGNGNSSVFDIPVKEILLGQTYAVSSNIHACSHAIVDKVHQYIQLNKQYAHWKAQNKQLHIATSPEVIQKCRLATEQAASRRKGEDYSSAPGVWVTDPLLQRYDTLCSAMPDDSALSLGNVLYAMTTAVAQVHVSCSDKAISPSENNNSASKFLYSSNIMEDPGQYKCTDVKGYNARAYAEKMIQGQEVILEKGDSAYNAYIETLLLTSTELSERDRNHVHEVYRYMQSQYAHYTLPWFVSSNKAGFPSRVQPATIPVPASELLSMTALSPTDALRTFLLLELQSQVSNITEKEELGILNRHYSRTMTADCFAQYLQDCVLPLEPLIRSKYVEVTDEVVLSCVWPVLHRRHQDKTYRVQGLIQTTVSFRDYILMTREGIVDAPPLTMLSLAEPTDTGISPSSLSPLLETEYMETVLTPADRSYVSITRPNNGFLSHHSATESNISHCSSNSSREGAWCTVRSEGSVLGLRLRMTSHTSSTQTAGRGVIAGEPESHQETVDTAITAPAAATSAAVHEDSPGTAGTSKIDLPPPVNTYESTFICQTPDGVRIAVAPIVASPVAVPNNNKTSKSSSMNMILSKTYKDGSRLIASTEGHITLIHAPSNLMQQHHRHHNQLTSTSTTTTTTEEKGADSIFFETSRMYMGDCVVRYVHGGFIHQDIYYADGTRIIVFREHFDFRPECASAFYIKLMTTIPEDTRFVNLSPDGGVTAYFYAFGVDPPSSSIRSERGGGGERVLHVSLQERCMEDALTGTQVTVFEDGRVLARHISGLLEWYFPDGTTSVLHSGTDTRGSVVFEKQGLHTIEVNLSADDDARTHAHRGRIPIARGADLVRILVSSPLDGSALAIRYDTRLTADVRASIHWVSREKCSLVVTDTGRVMYRPQASWSPASEASFHNQYRDICPPLTNPAGGKGNDPRAQALLTQFMNSSMFTATEQQSLPSPPAVEHAHRGTVSRLMHDIDTSNASKNTREEEVLRSEYVFDLLNSTAVLTDQDYNVFNIDLLASSPAPTVTVQLSGDIEGMKAEAVTESSLSPATFIIHRSGTITEVMSTEAVELERHKYTTSSSNVTRVPMVYSSDKACCQEVVCLRRRGEKERPQFSFRDVFPPRSWHHIQTPQSTCAALSSALTLKKHPSIHDQNVHSHQQVYERQVFIERPALSDEDREQFKGDIVRWRQFCQRRTGAVDEFRVSDVRTNDELELETTLSSRLRAIRKQQRQERKKRKSLLLTAAAAGEGGQSGQQQQQRHGESGGGLALIQEGVEEDADLDLGGDEDGSVSGDSNEDGSVAVGAEEQEIGDAFAAFCTASTATGGHHPHRPHSQQHHQHPQYEGGDDDEDEADGVGGREQWRITSLGALRAGLVQLLNANVIAEELTEALTMEGIAFPHTHSSTATACEGSVNITEEEFAHLFFRLRWLRGDPDDNDHDRGNDLHSRGSSPYSSLLYATDNDDSDAINQSNTCDSPPAIGVLGVADGTTDLGTISRKFPILPLESVTTTTTTIAAAAGSGLAAVRVVSSS